MLKSAHLTQYFVWTKASKKDTRNLVFRLTYSVHSIDHLQLCCTIVSLSGWCWHGHKHVKLAMVTTDACFWSSNAVAHSVHLSWLCSTLHRRQMIVKWSVKYRELSGRPSGEISWYMKSCLASTLLQEPELCSVERLLLRHESKDFWLDFVLICWKQVKLPRW